MEIVCLNYFYSIFLNEFFKETAACFVNLGHLIKVRDREFLAAQNSQPRNNRIIRLPLHRFSKDKNITSLFHHFGQNSDQMCFHPSATGGEPPMNHPCFHLETLLFSLG